MQASSELQPSGQCCTADRCKMSTAGAGLNSPRGLVKLPFKRLGLVKNNRCGYIQTVTSAASGKPTFSLNKYLRILIRNAWAKSPSEKTFYSQALHSHAA
jgi:hypothetical protein